MKDHIVTTKDELLEALAKNDGGRVVIMNDIFMDETPIDIPAGAEIVGAGNPELTFTGAMTVAESGRCYVSVLPSEGRPTKISNLRIRVFKQPGKVTAPLGYISAQGPQRIQLDLVDVHVQGISDCLYFNALAEHSLVQCHRCSFASAFDTIYLYGQAASATFSDCSFEWAADPHGTKMACISWGQIGGEVQVKFYDCFLRAVAISPTKNPAGLLHVGRADTRFINCKMDFANLPFIKSQFAAGGICIC